MAFEITSDTVVKILVRRGLEVERLETLLSEGELGLSVDTRRVFVGDGYTLGGTPVGSINFGIIGDLVNITPYAQPGDMASCKNINYVFNNNSWNMVSPKTYIELFADTPYACQTLEYSPDPSNSLRLSDTGLGDGLLIDYSQGPSGEKNNTIQKTYGQLNFDARFLSLCAYRTIYDNNDGPRVGSFYFGNIFTKTITDHLSTTVNIEKNLSINDHSLSAFQLKMTARSGDYNGSLIDATSGSLYIRSPGQIFLGTKSNGCSGLSVENNNVTVFGNLSVLGDVAYLNSIVSVTSALSVVNSGTGPALVVRQNGTQPIATFFDDTQSALRIMDGAKIQFFEENSSGGIGINTTNTSNALSLKGTISALGEPIFRALATDGSGVTIAGPNTTNDPQLQISRLDADKFNFRVRGATGAAHLNIYDQINGSVGNGIVLKGNNVGIGTDTPEQKLHVLKGSAGIVTAEINSIAVFEGDGSNHISILTPNGNTGGVVFGSPSDNYGSYLSWNYTNSELKLATAKAGGFISLLTDDETTQAVRITNTGNVGIGTTAPLTKLEVNGSLRVGRGNDLQFNSALKWSGAGTTDANSYMSGIANSTEQIRIDTNGVKISDSKTLTLGVGTNVALDTATGSKIGTATTQKLSFYNANPIVQPSSANQAALAAYVGGANGYSTTAQAQAIITLVNEIRTTLVNLGLMKGSA